MLHFRRNVLADAGLLVTVSQSGESAEVVRLIEGLGRDDRSPFVVAVTNGIDNTLARLAGGVLDTRTGDEVGPSTMTFAAALIVVATVARVLRGEAPKDAVSATRQGAEAAAGSIEALLSRSTLPDELTAWLGDRLHSVILARGPARAAAEMGALTLKEAIGMPIESLQTAQFRHGPLELAGPELAAIVIATEPETRDLDVGLAGELVAAGSGRDRRRRRRRDPRGRDADRHRFAGPVARIRGVHPARAAPRVEARGRTRPSSRLLHPRVEGHDT